jgi:hypothetical protein
MWVVSAGDDKYRLAFFWLGENHFLMASLSNASSALAIPEQRPAISILAMSGLFS